MTNILAISKLRALAAIAVALSLAIVAGDFLGWPAHPEEARERIDHINRFIEDRPSHTPQELRSFLSEIPRSPVDSQNPHPLAAILMWHPEVIGGFTALLFLILRPDRRDSVIVSIVCAFFLYQLVGLFPAICLLFGCATFVAIASLFPRLLQIKAAA